MEEPCLKRSKTLSKYNSEAHVEIIVIWNLSSFARLSTFRSKKVLKASCRKAKQNEIWKMYDS
jgi:hypothetical protein